MSSEHLPCQSDFGEIEDQDMGYYTCVMDWAIKEYRNMNCSKGEKKEIRTCA